MDASQLQFGKGALFVVPSISGASAELVAIFHVPGESVCFPFVPVASTTDCTRIVQVECSVGLRGGSHVDIEFNVAVVPVESTLTTPIVKASSPSLFALQRLHRRYFDSDNGMLLTCDDGEIVENFQLGHIPVALPYRRWGLGRPVELLHGQDLPAGWKHSSVQVPQGRCLTWQPCQPMQGLENPLLYEVVDVRVIGLPKAEDTSRFNLSEHGFTFARRRTSPRQKPLCFGLDSHTWFTDPTVGNVLEGEVRDWRTQLWERGLQDLLRTIVGKQFATAKNVTLVPLVDDLDRNKVQYDLAYHNFLRKHGAEYGLDGPEAQDWFVVDRDRDIQASTFMQRVGTPRSTPHLPALFELGDGARTRSETCQAYNRRMGDSGGNRGAVHAPHIDALVEGALSHLALAQGVTDCTACSSNDEFSCRAFSHREMFQCWIARGLVTCAPFAIFHDFEDGQGPLALVPELHSRDMVIFRTACGLHGSLPVAARWVQEVLLGKGESLGALLEQGIVHRVDAGGKAEAYDLMVGDHLVAVNGEPVEQGISASRMLADAMLNQTHNNSKEPLRLTFELPRKSRRRSMEFRFFAYWDDVA